MSIEIPKVEFPYYIRIFCVYYRYVKPERKSFSEEEKKIFNNTIIDSIITGMDRWVLSVLIHIYISAMWGGFYVLVTHQKLYYTNAMRLLSVL